ncbi:TIGR03617 family F420-dependent LLM class oxidoreductase [Nocardioides sp. Bht2]|uniref:TIGR03617 family F420-dependent LLM class oxidoreductase n=1 Tax=Nocardioides sp. Bht2 TaxID=3392297 RepID=UPI0039B46D01
MEIVASLPGRIELAEVAAVARRVEALGFDTLHVPETIHDPFSVATLALQATSRLVVRTSMVLAFPRSPMVTAVAAWDLSRFSGGRFQLGVASQVRGNIVGRYSMPWTDPVAQLGDYIDSLRAIFTSFQTGAELNHQGSHYQFTRLQPYFNPGPLDHAAPSIWTGGVNARMTALAGARSDGFVAHPTTSHPRMLNDHTIPALERGATAAGRSDLPRIVAGPQPVLAPDQATLAAQREARRSELAFLYSTPAYRRQLEAFGLAGLGEALSAMAQAQEWAGLADHLTDEVIATLVPQGTYAQMPELLNSWYAGLCDGLVLAAPAPGTDDDAFRALVAGCREIPGR